MSRFYRPLASAICIPTHNKRVRSNNHALKIHNIKLLKASCLSSALDAFKAKSYADYIPNVKRTEPKRYVFVNWYGEQLGHEDVEDLEEAKKIAESLQCEVYDREMEEPVYNCWRGDL